MGLVLLPIPTGVMQQESLIIHLLTAMLLGAYYGPNEAGSYVEGSPEGATSSLPQAGHYDKTCSPYR